MPLYLVAGPSRPAVSLVDMKKHLRVDFDDDDDLIESLTAAATQHIDGRDGKLGRALVAQTWDLRINGFPCGEIELPLPPLLSVESVTYYDVDNALQTLPTTYYEVIGVGGEKPGRIVLKSGQSWPTSYARQESVIVRLIAGYVDTSDSPAAGEIPAPIVAAIKLLAAHWYENREPVNIGNITTNLPLTVDALLAPFRVYGF